MAMFISDREFHKIMAAIDDLNAAVSKLSSDVQALIAKQGGTSDAAIQTVTTQVTALDAQVQGVLNPPPPAP